MRDLGDMTYVASMFVKKMIDQAPESLDRAELFAGMGITEEEASNPNTVVLDTQYYALLETIAAAEAPDISFHLRTSAAMTCADFGAVGLAWKCAPTLR